MTGYSFGLTGHHRSNPPPIALPKKLGPFQSAYFDAAESRAQSHKPTYMADWLAHLDRLIIAMGVNLLTGAGSVSHHQAVTKAETEYDKYRTQLDAAPSEVEEAYLDNINRAQHEIEKQTHRVKADSFAGIMMKSRECGLIRFQIRISLL